MRRPECIGVIGAGAVGSILAARLIHAGAKTLLLARADTLVSIQDKGIEIQSRLATDHVPARIVRDIAGPVEQCDALIVAVKRHHSAGIQEHCRRWLRQNGVVITLQNGLDAALDFADIGAQVTAGAVFTSATRDRADFVRLIGSTFRVMLPSKEVPEYVVESMSDGGVEVELTEDIDAALWRKTAFIATVGGLACLIRTAVGKLQGDQELLMVAQAGFEEAVRVGMACGVVWQLDPVPALVSDFHSLPAEMRPSMLVDLECGRPLELPWLSGKLVEKGEMFGVLTPLHALISHVLKPYTSGSDQSRATSFTSREQLPT